MEGKIWLSDKALHDVREKKRFFDFTQKMASRISMGHLRYGQPMKELKMLTRLRMELKAYRKTGNMEHLINIANYAWLESEVPENPKFHFDPTAESATRAKMGGAREHS